MSQNQLNEVQGDQCTIDGLHFPGECTPSDRRHPEFRLHSASCPSVPALNAAPRVLEDDALALAWSAASWSFDTVCFSSHDHLASLPENLDGMHELSDPGLKDDVAEGVLFSAPWEVLDPEQESCTQEWTVPESPHGTADSELQSRPENGVQCRPLDLDSVKTILELSDDIDGTAGSHAGSGVSSSVHATSSSSMLGTEGEHAPCRRLPGSGMEIASEGGRLTPEACLCCCASLEAHDTGFLPRRCSSSTLREPCSRPSTDLAPRVPVQCRETEEKPLAPQGAARQEDPWIPCTPNAAVLDSVEEYLTFPSSEPQPKPSMPAESQHFLTVRGSRAIEKPTPLAARLAGVLRSIKPRDPGLDKGAKREASLPQVTVTEPQVRVLSQPRHERATMVLSEDKLDLLSRQRRKVELTLDSVSGLEHTGRGCVAEEKASGTFLPWARTPSPANDSVAAQSSWGGAVVWHPQDALLHQSSPEGRGMVPLSAAVEEIRCYPAGTSSWTATNWQKQPGEAGVALHCSQASGVEIQAQPVAVPNSPGLNWTEISSSAVRCSIPKYSTQVTRQLMRLATAYSTGDMVRARKWVVRLRTDASPTGVAVQRLLHYMIYGLVARFEDGAHNPMALVQPFFPPVCAQQSLVELGFASIKQMYGNFTEVFLSCVLKRALGGHSRVHVLVITSGLCPDWNDLFRHLVACHQGPQELRIRVTILVRSVEADQAPQMFPEFCVLAKSVGQAAQGLRLSVPCKLAMVSPQEAHTSLARAVQVHPGEVLGVVSWTALYHTPDGSVLRHNPRDAVLKWISGLSPAVLAVVDVDANLNTPFFLARFSESLRMSSAIFQWLDHTGYSSQGRGLCAPVIPSMYELKIGLDFVNCIAAEGLARFQRAENLGMWRDRMRRLGFWERPLDEECFGLLRSEVLHRGLHVENVDGFASLRREESPLLFAGVWVTEGRNTGKERS